MKNALHTCLGILIGLIFAKSVAFAISGGPFPAAKNVVGTYAGVLITKPNLADSPPGCSANSLGVFSIGVPTTGVSNGAFVMFSQGRVFSGTVQGTADPDRGTLKGVLSASFNFTVTFPPTPCPNPTPAPACTPSSFSEAITASATGKLDTHIRSNQSFTGSSTRLSGTATLDISHGEVDFDLEPIVTCQMTLRVVGFKQSSAAPTGTTSG